MTRFILTICFFSSSLFFLASEKKDDIEESKKYRNPQMGSFYQWETDLDSVIYNNGDDFRRAFLWVPPQCIQLKGIIIAGHNSLEEGIIEDSLFRSEMEQLNFGIIWVTPGLCPAGVFNVNSGAQKIFDEAVNNLADISGYNEIRFAPVVYISHSAQASQPWNFGAWNSQRTLAMISFHGDSPRSTYLCCNHFNPDWGNRNIDGIPGLLCIGSGEWQEFRVEGAFKFMKQYPGSVISLLCNAGRGHNDFSQEDIRYLVKFIKKTVMARMPDKWDGKSFMPLKKMRREESWLADRWHKNAPPSVGCNTYYGYAGNKDSAFWYIDEEMARWTESIYTRERDKKQQYLALVQNRRILKPGEKLTFLTDGKNIDIHAKVVFTDSTYTHLSKEHSIEPIMIKRYCGPINIVNDTTFRLNFYRPGVHHSRVGTVGLFAFSESDFIYGHVVRDMSFKIKASLTEGIEQEITFPEIDDVDLGTKYIQLKAKSSSGLPVNYYVQSGPAYVLDDRVFFTDIPPKAKFPIKVTVVAWQYGSMSEPKVQTAKAVSRHFCINGI
ncbi:MAG: hypothetical protein PHQ11_07920 [Paludibacter sp.]|nr:hypothetical protein [Paludibacter sp.]